jgi:hypothetical protein
LTGAAARALCLVAALLSARAWFDASAAPIPSERVAPERGPARLLYGAQLDANREPAEVLALLPGIGPVRARAIVSARPLCSLAELDRLNGIGPATLRALGSSLAFPALPRNCGRNLRAGGD